LARHHGEHLLRRPQFLVTFFVLGFILIFIWPNFSSSSNPDPEDESLLLVDPVVDQSNLEGIIQPSFSALKAIYQ